MTVAVPEYRHRAGTQQRADIQGLRAIAVLLVIAQHFWNIPEGGYIGVDIFFVISGFLISSIILRDIKEYGKVRLPRFYARRLRRITPVALFVSLVTIGLTWITWYRPQALQYTLDGLWANLWVANWHFAGAGTDYLAHSANPSPFQHYWSLSVEEQFYVAWPLILALGWWAGRKARKAERGIDFVIVATIFLSALWAVLFTDYRATWAYFDTVSRACEFALGALVALLAAGRRFSPQLGLLGLVIIAVSALTFTASTPFPGPFALLPALGAALVLLPVQQTVPVVLICENPIMRWIGDISYSLYLWHFPVLIFLTTWFGSSSPVLALALGSTFGLSALSYYWIENPIRRSGLFSSWERPDRNTVTSRWLKAGNLVSLTALVCLGALALWQFMPSKYGVLAPQTMKVERAEASVTYSTLGQAQSAIEASSHTSWKTDMLPSPDTLTQEQMGEAMAPSTSCAVGFGDTALKICDWNPGQSSQKTVLVIGDSVALAWTPAVLAASDRQTRVLAAGVGSCSIMSIQQEADFRASGFAEKCATTRQALIQLVADTRPDTVVIASAAGGYNYQLNPSGELIGSPLEKQANWQRATEETLSQLQPLASQVVLLGSPGLTKDPRTCITRIGNTSDCTADLEQFQRDKEEAEAAAVDSLNREGGQIRRFDALAVTCDSQGKCPVAVGPYITHTDPTHLTQVYAQSLAPLLKPVLFSQQKG